MASKNNPMNRTKGGIEYVYPSRFGSHATMATEDQEGVCEGFTRLEDDKGVYLTETNRLDNKLADPNRNSSSRFQ